MLAYRLGQLPDVERHKEQEQLPLGARVGYRGAKHLTLPALEEGALLREQVMEKLERKLSEWKQEAA